MKKEILMEVSMKNENKLTNIQFSCLIFFPIFAFFSGIGTHNLINIAKVDAYISVLLSYIIGLIPLGLFLLIFNYKKDLDIKDKIKYLFGKPLGIVINYLIVVLLILASIVSFHGLSNFIISQLLTETPITTFMFLLSIILIYNVSLGIENIARVSIIFLGIIIGLTILSTLGVVPHFEMSNLKPFLENGINPPLKGGIILTLTNVIPIFILLTIPKEKIQNNKKTTKHIFFFYTLAFILIFITIFLTLSSLGIYLCDVYQYPEYTALKKISFFNFIDRIENLVYVKWFLSSVICLSLFIYYLRTTIKKSSKVILPTIICIALTYLSLNIFKNNTIYYNFILNIYPYINLLLLSIFIIIALNIIVRKIMKLDNLIKE